MNVQWRAVLASRPQATVALRLRRRTIKNAPTPTPEAEAGSNMTEGASGRFVPGTAQSPVGELVEPISSVQVSAVPKVPLPEVLS